MNNLRKKYGPEEKAKISLEALKGELTYSQITSKYGPHSTQIANWKKILQRGIVDIFRDKRQRESQDQNQLIDELYKQVGQLKVELDWAKKKYDLFSK